MAEQGEAGCLTTQPNLKKRKHPMWDIFLALFDHGMFERFTRPSMEMGVGIAIDVMIATIVQFRNPGLTWFTWTLPITLTHIAFPAFGYYGFWGASLTWAPVSVALGIAGAALVALFAYETICGWIGAEPAIAISAWLRRSRFIVWLAKIWPAFMGILIVSFDALWSGPAKAAQAAVGHWTTNEVLGSFIIAGATVALCSQFSLIVAYGLRLIQFGIPWVMATINFVAKFLELSVIGGFGTLSLWQGLNSANSIVSAIFGLESPTAWQRLVGAEAELHLAIKLTACVMILVFFWFRKELAENELNDARNAIEGDGEEVTQ